MCSFDWEKRLLFIYSTWEKECAPSLKRVEKPLWRKKDPCTTTRDIDYHCSYWRHVTLCTSIIIEQWHVTLNTSVINVEENNLKNLVLCSLSIFETVHLSIKKKRALWEKQYGLEKICWDNLKCLNPLPLLWRLFFQQCILSKCSLHTCISGARQIFVCVYVDVFIKIQERNNKE